MTAEPHPGSPQDRSDAYARRLAAEDAKSLVRRHFEAFSAHDEEATAATIGASFFNHEAAGTDREAGLEGFRRTFRMLTGAFSDLSYDLIEVLAAEAGRIVVRCRMSGTHDGPFRGVPATGRRFAVDHIHIFRVDDDHIVEHWAARDDLTMMRQLGVIELAGGGVTT
jgi:steroid delta-isomerase-like uncharacterized protein